MKMQGYRTVWSILVAVAVFLQAVQVVNADTPPTLVSLLLKQYNSRSVAWGD